ncbi:hypothetical protein D3C72_786760 [compost metagenome]
MTDLLLLVLKVRLIGLCLLSFFRLQGLEKIEMLYFEIKEETSLKKIRNYAYQNS